MNSNSRMLALIFTLTVILLVGKDTNGAVFLSPNEDSQVYWHVYNQKHLKNLLNNGPEVNEKKAKNIIIFVGDGMGIQTTTAGRIYKGQVTKGNAGEEEELVWEKFPYTGLSKTYNTDKQVPDSAGTATALFSAVKTKYGVLGLDSTCQKYSMETGKVQGLMTWAQKEGKRTGFVTTTRVTHATPAALYAHTPERDYEGDEIIPTGSSIMDIAKQLVDNAPGNKFNVIMGGGRVAMGDPDPVPPEIPFKFEGSMEKIVGRKDGVNLADLWLERKEVQDGYAVYVHNRSELNKVDTKQTDYLLGLFANSHMTYDALRNYTDEPSLAEMTVKAIEVLEREDSKGYVLMVEGGKIDHAHHQNFAKLALIEVLGLDKAVEAALNKVGDDTLVIVTADHSHSLTFNGYPGRGNDILGFGNKNNVEPYETLTYANGPGFFDHRAKKDYVNPRFDTWIRAEELDRSSPVYRHLAAFPTGDETHGGEDVAVYARGPGAHLLRGSMEQTFIGYVMSYAGCMGPAQYANKACHEHHWFNNSSSKVSISSSGYLLALLSVLFVNIVRLL